MKLFLRQLHIAIITPQKSRMNNKQSPLHLKMITKEIAAKVAQFEYELDFQGAQTHALDLVQVSKLCRFVPASKLCKIVSTSKQVPQICASNLH
jgi:hypothetical protein